ncbi:MAG: EAL domain-containing protein [Pseudomonadota bacterium]
MRIPTRSLKSGYRVLLIGAVAGMITIFLIEKAVSQRLSVVNSTQDTVLQTLSALHDATANAAKLHADGSALAMLEPRLLASLDRLSALSEQLRIAPIATTGLPDAVESYAQTLRLWHSAGDTTVAPPLDRVTLQEGLIAEDRAFAARRAVLRGRLDQIETGGLIAQILILAAIATLILRPLRSNLEASDAKLSAVTADLMTCNARDEGTGLANEQALQLHIADLPTGETTPRVVAVMLKFLPVGRASHMIDADVFRQLMREIGERLKKLVGEGDFLSFCGQGKFCVLRQSARSEPVPVNILPNLDSLFEDPIRIEDQRFALRVRTGFAHREEEDTPARLIKKVQIALDKALDTAAEAPVAYTPELGFETEQRKQLTRDLMAGLSRNELQAHFQPQVNLRTGRVVGFEALVRWYHPTRGVMSPFFFLPLAEKNGLEDILGEIVTTQAINALKTWDAAGHGVTQIGVNFSASQLGNSKLVDTLKWTLDAADLSPQRLAVEVLENIHVDSDTDPVMVNLKRLSELGCRIDLDDFGTGFASISGLRRFHANRIKIDRSFITGIDHNTDNRTMVGVMISMAKGLRLDVLAEGVETQEEATTLQGLGCTDVQGYMIAKPMPFEDTVGWLEEHNRKWQERRESRRSIAI